MSKFTINFACGHGSFEEQIVGPTKDRQGRADWLANNKVCPDCYRAKKAAEEAAAPKGATLVLVPAAEPVIAIEVTGKIEANKDALYAAGYRWSDSHSGGLLGYLSMRRPARTLAVMLRITNIEQMQEWVKTQKTALEAIGYPLTNGVSALDSEYLLKMLAKQADIADSKAAAKARMAEINATDPRPAAMSLRIRIAGLEKSTGQKWNGKIYGKKGYWNFYVANENYKASDEEVAEREENLAACAAWDKKYAAEIAAAK